MRKLQFTPDQEAEWNAAVLEYQENSTPQTE